MAAMVATQLPRLEVYDEIRAAPVARGMPRARAAEKHRCEAAPVDEHERLLARGHRAPDRIEERRGESFARTIGARVDGAYARQRGARRPGAQARERIASIERIGIALERRRGRAEDDGNRQAFRT